jgi:hypothetical protein
VVAVLVAEWGLAVDIAAVAAVVQEALAVLSLSSPAKSSTPER